MTAVRATLDAWVKAASQTLERGARGSVVLTLYPIVPGHCVVAPPKPVSSLLDLTEDELADIFSTAASAAARHLKEDPRITAFNLAVKDGTASLEGLAAVHVVPRRPGDLPPDAVHGLLDAWAACPDGAADSRPPLALPPDDQRVPRSAEVMAAEAALYARAGVAISPLFAVPAETETPIHFGPFPLKSACHFFESPLTRAFVNLKPLVSGHVLVSPRRVVPRLQDLTREETMDLWKSVQLVQALIQRVHGASGAHLGVQDGRDAGQSVPHVHVHVLPVGCSVVSV
jgi:diadenosine tetraphosphate (Ap4A) HIT family hydrolase